MTPDEEARLEALELRFNLLVLDVRELLTVVKDEPSLVARRPHLVREMAEIDARLKAAYRHHQPKRAWWRRP